MDLYIRQELPVFVAEPGPVPQCTKKCPLRGTSRTLNITLWAGIFWAFWAGEIVKPWQGFVILECSCW